MVDRFSEKLTEKMFIEASRKSPLHIARLYLIDSSSLKTFTSSSFLYSLIILENPYLPSGFTERWWILDKKNSGKQKHLTTQLSLNNVIFKKEVLIYLSGYSLFYYFLKFIFNWYLPYVKYCEISWDKHTHEERALPWATESRAFNRKQVRGEA